MTLVSFPVPEADGHAGEPRLIADWVVWLGERLDAQWRGGEWDENLLLFTGDPDSPHTIVTVCPLPSCGVTTNSPHASGYCKTCHDEFMESGLTKEAFEASYTRRNRRLNVYRRETLCEVPVCRRDSHGQGLCVTHYRSWVKARDRPDIDRVAWMAALGPAAVPGPGVREGADLGPRPVQDARRQMEALVQWDSGGRRRGP
jgi:hypothetical protein